MEWCIFDRFHRDFLLFYVEFSSILNFYIR